MSLEISRQKKNCRTC